MLRRVPATISLVVALLAIACAAPAASQAANYFALAALLADAIERDVGVLLIRRSSLTT
jgi:hypothetical protein